MWLVRSRLNFQATYGMKQRRSVRSKASKLKRSYKSLSCTGICWSAFDDSSLFSHALVLGRSATIMLEASSDSLWRPKFLINLNSRSNSQPWSNLGQPGPSPRKNSLTHPSDPNWIVNTFVGPTHGQRLGQTHCHPSVHRSLPELLPHSPKFT
jgi:hypothetical protein